MLITLCFIDAYNHPVALSVLHRFQYLSVLSNAQDQYTSRPLPNVQDVAYLSPPCLQPAVLRPCMRLYESLNIFAKSWLKVTSLGLHRVVLAYVNRSTFRCRHYEFIIRVFLNMFDHVYAISKHCYLFHRLSMPCPTLLHLRMQKSFFLSHDFEARMLRLSRRLSYSPVNCLQTVAFNCRRFCSSLQCRTDSRCSAAWRFKLGCRKPLIRLKHSGSSPCLNSEKVAKPPVMCRMGVGYVGGGSQRGVSWASIESFSESTPETFDKCSTFLYAAHIDRVAGLENYPPSKYVYAMIPSSRWWMYYLWLTSEL